MQAKYEKFSIKIESDESLEELMNYLKLKRDKLTSQSEKRIVSRLRYKARKLGLRNFSELLNHLKNQVNYQVTHPHISNLLAAKTHYHCWI